MKITSMTRPSLLALFTAFSFFSDAQTDAGFTYGTAASSTTGFVISPLSNPSYGLKLDKDGNVGIGTTDTKGNQLAVNGTGIFNKVKVKLYGNWSDYVFANGYHLPPLSEVEKYIASHKHLPDVPSASEVKQNGIDVEEIQTVLLKKIEELTLYVINLQKEVESLKQKAKGKSSN